MSPKLQKPRGRCTPYAFFLNVCRDQCAKKLSREVDFKVLQKICSKKWSLMSDYHKVRFVQMSSVIKNHASKKLNTPIEKLSLKQIAAFADENYKQRKSRKSIEKRQHDLIEYFESLVKLNKIDNFV